MDIKVESEPLNQLCYGCLSVDRSITRISGEYMEIFYKLRGEDNHNINAQELQLCWECIAFLKKLKTFQLKIKTAQHYLLQYCHSYCIENEISKPLTTLKTTHIHHYNAKLNHDNITQEIHPTEELNRLNLNLYQPNELEINEVKIKNEIKYDNYDSNIKYDNDDSGYNCDEYMDYNKKETTYYKRKVYVSNAIISKNTSKFKECIEKVYLTYNQIEAVIIRERKRYDMSFECNECGLKYGSVLDLQRHTSFCHNKSAYPHKCLACSTIVISPEHLEEHWTTHTSMIKCILCSGLTVFRSNVEMKKHIKNIHNKFYSCKECQQEYGALREFIIHYKSKHKTIEKFVCDYCKRSFVKKKSIITHIKRYHIPAYCNTCNRTYANRKSLLYHNQCTHPELITGETCKELCYCVECDKQYPSVLKYKKHLHDSPRHTPQKKIRVPCPDCGKVFTRTSFMRNHYRFAHLKVTKHYCDKCDKYYTTGYGLRQHIERVHKKIAQPKNKICDICGRGFGTNKILTNHRRTHTGERPHKCKYCPAAFAQETAMKTHQKTQHKNILESAS